MRLLILNPQGLKSHAKEYWGPRTATTRRLRGYAWVYMATCVVNNRNRRPVSRLHERLDIRIQRYITTQTSVVPSRLVYMNISVNRCEKVKLFYRKLIKSKYCFMPAKYILLSQNMLPREIESASPNLFYKTPTKHHLPRSSCRLSKHNHNQKRQSKHTIVKY